MDSKKRHELETNDLREFLDNFKDFWDKNGNSILIALIVVVGGYAAYNWYTKNQTTKSNDAYQALADANGGAVLLGVAEDHPRVRAAARQRAGDAYLAEARSAAAQGDEDEKNKQLDSAEAAYQGVIDDGDSDLLKINAYLGLATAAEMRGAWDKAKGFYDDASELAGERYARLATIAQESKAKVDDLRDPVAFGEDEPELPLGGNPDLFPIDPIDPSDLDGDGTPDRLQRPEDLPTPGTTPGTPSGGSPLFPDNDPAIGGGIGDDTTGEAEPPAIDPLLLPGLTDE